MNTAPVKYFLSANPLLRPLLFFLTGILLAANFPSWPWIKLLWIVPPFCVLGLAAHQIFLRQHLRWSGIEGMFSFFGMVVLGAGLFSLKIQQHTQLPSIVAEQSDAVLVRLVGKPVVRERTVKCEAEVEAIHLGKKWIPVESRLLCRLERNLSSSKLKYGDELIITGHLEHPDGPANPGEMDYRAWLERKGMHWQMYARDGEWQLKRENCGSKLMAWAINVRTTLIQKFYLANWNPRERAVASALILGATDELDPGLVQAYSISGVLHVLSVSGLHVSIVFLVFGKLLAPLARKNWGKWIRIVLLLVLVWFYALITGLSPAVLRAACMLSFVIAGEAMEKRGQTFNLLCASALLLLVINPALLFDVGFQLSFLAVAGIVLFNPAVDAWFEPRTKIGQHVWGLTSVSIVAQLITLPLTLVCFRQFPLYFLPANLILIPLSTIAMYAGLGFLVVSLIPGLNHIVSWIAEKIFWLLNEAVLWTERLPAASLQTTLWSGIELCLLIAVLVFTVLFLKRKELRFLTFSGALLLCLIVKLGFAHYDRLQQQNLVIHSLPHATALGLISGEEEVLLADTAVIKKTNVLEMHCLVSNDVFGWKNDTVIPFTDSLEMERHNMRMEDNYMQFGKWQLLALARQKKKTKLPNCDLLLLCRNTYYPLDSALNQTQAKLVVADGSNGKKRIEKWRSICLERHIPFVDIRQSGALVIDVSKAPDKMTIY